MRKHNGNGKFLRMKRRQLINNSNTPFPAHENASPDFLNVSESMRVHFSLAKFQVRFNEIEFTNSKIHPFECEAWCVMTSIKDSHHHAGYDTFLQLKRSSPVRLGSPLPTATSPRLWRRPTWLLHLQLGLF